MDQFLATDVEFVHQLSQLGAYEYVIVGSGIGGGILAEELAKRQKKVLLIERGEAIFSTHFCNTARPDFARGRHDSPEGNETIYNKLKSWVEPAEDSEPFIGGPLFCLGGRSLVWGLWIPRTDPATLHKHFPAAVALDLEKTWFKNAFNLVTNNSQTKNIYPEGVISATELEAAKEQLTKEIASYLSPGHTVGLGPIATELISPAPYRFPRGAYSTVVPLLNRIYSRDEYLTVLMGAEVIQLDIPETNDPIRSVKSLRIRQTSNQRIHHISTGRAKVILSAGTICTANIALNSGLQFHNPLVGKGVLDHAIWGVRFAKRATDTSKDPMNLQTMINICGTTALLTVTINNNFFLAGSSTLPIHQYFDKDGTIIAPAKGRQDIKEKDFDTIAILLEYGAELDDENEVLNVASPNPTIRIRRRETHNDEESQIEMQQLATRIRNHIITNVLPSDKEKSTVLIPPHHHKPSHPALPPPFIPGPPDTMAPRLTLLESGIYAHEVGTMRMDGPGNRRGVVDTNLKVHGFSNLHACDLSVLPYSPPANPTLTLASLSLRLAEHLAPA